MVQDLDLNVAFDPQSIAVVGASSDDNAEKKGWVGRLQEFGFKGKIYPINPKAPVILGLKAYPSVKAVPDVPLDTEDFFLNSCFWGFPSECSISNANLQFGFENRSYFQRQFSA